MQFEYHLHNDADIQAMLASIGIASLKELFEAIDPGLRVQGSLNLPPALGELELEEHLRELAEQNRAAGTGLCFLGGGAYDHFIPAVVDAIASRSEFVTAYTPYQPEASQGTLEAMFEYQTLIARLTGMDLANASLYDGASAAAEAVLMALGATGRKRVLVAGTLHPEYRRVIETYLQNLEVSLEVLPWAQGALDPADVLTRLDSHVACLVVQCPNFFGSLEPVDQLAKHLHEVGGLFIVVFYPISLGLLKRPGDYGADIAVAEGQSLGIPMGFGGPYLGILACREALIRRLPGRLVGQTVDRLGRRCWVLTLQTREQHIRREKATSNICTNQGLMALRAAVYLAVVGPWGLRQLAELCLQKAHYACDQLASIAGLTRAFEAPFFNEFVLRDRRGNLRQELAQLEKEGFFVGPSLGRWYPELEDCFLVAVTEKRSRGQIDRLVERLAHR